MAPPPTEDLLAELPWLRRFAAGLVRSAADADDLVQDTLSTALAAKRPAGPLRGFLAGVARNLARASHRRDARRGEREARHAADAGSPAGAAADADAERLDLLRALLDELATLPPAQRRAITGRYLDELEPAAMADRDGVSPASVRAQLSRGLSALRERLDGREGGRDAWLACLAPWALAPPGPAGPDQPPTAAVPTPTATGALLAGAVTMKLAAFLVVPALLAGLWWTGRTPDLPAPTVPVEASATDGQGTAALAAVEEETRTEEPVQGSQTPEPAAQAGKGVAAPRLEGTVRGRLVDMLTGEPVPDLMVELQHPDFASGGAPRERSDAGGFFEMDRAAIHADSRVRVVERDHAPLGERPRPRQSIAPFPLEAPIPVHVGPTFRLDLPEEYVEDAWRLRARFRVPDDARPFDDPMTTCREGTLPWLRFPRRVTELEGGAFDVVIDDLRGLRCARLRVHRNRGIEPEPLRPVFEDRGAVRFVLTGASAAGAAALEIEVSPAGHEVPPDVELVALTGQHGADGTVSGTLRMLPPGDYTYVIVGAGTGAGGAFTVAPLETVEVPIGKDALGATFDAEVLIDATAAPDAEVTHWLVMVTSEDERGAGFMTSPTPVEGAPAGRYSLPLEALRQGTWRVTLQWQGDVSVIPSSLLVTPGAAPEEIRVTPGSPLRTLTLSVQDEATGDPVGGATAVVVQLPMTAFEFKGTDAMRTSLVSRELPPDATVEIFVRASGYRGIGLRHDPGEDPAERVVKLERGWRNRVLALDITTMKPAAGLDVLVDGERVGETDGTGWLWIEGERPPLSVEVVDPSGRLQVQDAGMSGELSEETVDPTYGFLFVASPKDR